MRNPSSPRWLRIAPAAALLAAALSSCSKGGGASGGDGGGGGGTTASLAGVASVTFPAGALPAGATVAVEQRTDAATFAAFADSAGIYGPTGTGSSYVRIAVAGGTPTGTASVVVNVPAGLVPPAGGVVRLFGRLQEVGDYDQYDAFEDLAGTWNAAAGTVTAALPAATFVPSRGGTSDVEAILLLATSHAIAGPSFRQLAGTPCVSPSLSCATACIHTPLLRTLRVTSRFHDPKRSSHDGTDLRAETGTTAVSVGVGTLRESRLSPNLPPGCVYAADMKNSPVPCTGNWGYGETVLLDIAGVGSVRYLHLGSRTFADCCNDVDGNPCHALPPCTVDGTVGGPPILVATGDPVGTTDTTGYTAEAHLHLDMVVGDAKVDPAPCILPPDYHGKYTNSWDEVTQSGTFTMTVTANANFKWAQSLHKYQTDGTWDVSALGQSNVCTVSITNHAGPIGADDGVLLLGGFMNELLAGAYFMGYTPTPPLRYEFAGATQTPYLLNYTCNPGGSGAAAFLAVFWWPNELTSPNYPFYARPNPYSPSDPFEDFVESDVPNFPPSLATQTSSWTVSARMTPP